MGKSTGIKHGLGGHPLYHVWSSMKTRCNTKLSYGENWAGRGIKVCDEWKTFMPFYSWAIANGYQRGLSLDRTDNNGNYTPDNCRFTDWSTQNKNKRPYRSMPRPQLKAV